MERSAGVLAWLVVAGAIALATDASAERQPYERYQSIVNRQMFGPLPVGFDPTKSPSEVSKSGSAAEKELTKEQEKVKSAIRFSVINVTPQGETAIGFTDNSDPKAPVHYYLKEGESRGGWTVKEADAKTATMTIAKDGIEVSLSLGGDSAKDGKTQAVDADERTSTVTIDKEGRISLGETPVSIDDLGHRLTARLRENPELTLVVRADEESRHGDVMAVKLLARKIGVPKILEATSGQEAAR